MPLLWQHFQREEVGPNSQMRDKFWCRDCAEILCDIPLERQRKREERPQDKHVLLGMPSYQHPSQDRYALWHTNEGWGLEPTEDGEKWRLVRELNSQPSSLEFAALPLELTSRKRQNYCQSMYLSCESYYTGFGIVVN